MLLLALSLLVAPAPAATVVLDGATWEALRGPDPEAPPVPPGIVVDARVVTLSAADGRVRAVARWQVRAVGPAAFADLRLGDLGWSPERILVDGREGALEPRSDGWRLVTKVDRPITIELTATRPGDPTVGDVLIDLLAAPRGTVVAPGLHVAAVDPALRVGSTTRAAGKFRLVPADVRARDRGDLVVATSAVGMTLGDAEARVKARVSWEVRRGKLATLVLDAPGAGRDLEVRGAIVRSWRREGDRVFVEPLRPVDGAASVELSWTIPLPATSEARLAVPRVAPIGVYRTEGALVLARATEAEAVPDVPATPIARQELPRWGDGLVDGEATAFYKLGAPPSGSVSLVRYAPVEQPPMLIDRADVRIATSDEGRVLSRTYLTVRNERAARLRIVPPEGTELLGVQVSGEPVVPARDDGPGWLIALPRSVETVDGLLTFPIEVIARGTGPAWSERERRAIPLLRFDAQVALTRVTLALPPGWHSRAEGGDVVPAFTEGETLRYGMAVGDAAAAQVDTLFQGAVDAWLDNDWDAAQDKLDDIRSAGGDNENVRRLQGNLDLVAGKDTGATEVVERRVREQALARASSTAQEAEQSLREAEEAEQRGDTDEAEKKYEEAYTKADVAAKLERKESMTYKSVQSSSSAGLSKAKKKQAEAQNSAFSGDPLAIEGEVQKPEVVEFLGEVSGATGFGVSGYGAGGGGTGELGWLGDELDGKSGLIDIPADPNLVDATTAPDEVPIVYRSRTEIDFEDVEIDGDFGVDDGVEGGVVGGVVGGVSGGVLHGEVAPAPPPPTTPTPDFLERIPTGRSYQSAVTAVPGASRPSRSARDDAKPAAKPAPEPVELPETTAYFENIGGETTVESVTVSSRKPARQAAGRGGAAVGSKGVAGKGAVAAPPKTLTLEVGGRTDGDADVFASALTLYVPQLGETVLYQHLLLESDTPCPLVVDAYRRAKDRRTR